MKRYYCFFLVLLILSSCEKVLEFDGAETESKLVLNAFLTPGEPVQVRLTKSRFFLDNNNTPWEVKDARVELWRNGEQINVLNESEVEDGLYYCDYYPKEGDTLMVTASVSGLDPIQAIVTIPYAIPIVSVDTIAVEIDENYYYDDDDYENYVSYDLHIRIKDEANVTNYYRICPIFETVYAEGEISRQPIWFEKDDLVFGGINLIEMGENEYGEFSDELFDGREHTLKIRIDHYIYSGSFYGDIQSAAIVVELHHIEEGFYHYLRSRTAASAAEDYGGLFVEPVQIYSNVEGGIGILGGYAVDSYQIPIIQ